MPDDNQADSAALNEQRPQTKLVVGAALLTALSAVMLAVCALRPLPTPTLWKGRPPTPTRRGRRGRRPGSSRSERARRSEDSP